MLYNITTTTQYILDIVDIWNYRWKKEINKETNKNYMRDIGRNIYRNTRRSRLWDKQLTNRKMLLNCECKNPIHYNNFAII